jgi:hypothetical protein
MGKTNGKKREGRATLDDAANQNGKKRAARKLLASVVKEMAKPRLAASVGRDIGKKERPVNLQSVQK